jgi:hypothetical protein
MGDDQIELAAEIVAEAHEIVMSTITAALTAKLDGEDDLYEQLIGELGETRIVVLQAVLMTQASTIVSAVLVMAKETGKDPWDVWRAVALNLSGPAGGLPPSKPE